MVKFKEEDRVVKARPFLPTKYCAHGGYESDVPIGSKGTIMNCSNSTSIEVEFDCGETWHVDSSEIELVEDYLKQKDKPKPVSLEYKPGTSITKYVKELIKVEKDDTRLKWLKTFDNCVLPEEVKSSIDEALTIVLRRDKFEEWGLNEHFEKGITNSILLHGPPGTGKSMVSESIAAVLGKNLMKLDTGIIQSNVPGQTERNIGKAFDEAKKNNCVLLLDECDGLLYKRDAVGMIMSSEINKLLTELERFDGVVILTTNRMNVLDEALRRRIIAIIELPLPNEKARNMIWKNSIPKKMPVSKDVNFKELAKVSIAGGDIKNVVLLAARKAIAKNRDEVVMEDFSSAMTNVVNGIQNFQNSKKFAKDF